MVGCADPLASAGWPLNLSVQVGGIEGQVGEGCGMRGRRHVGPVCRGIRRSSTLFQSYSPLNTRTGIAHC